MNASLKLANVSVSAPKPVAAKDGSVVHLSSVDYLGGSLRAANPRKLSGLMSEVVLTAKLDTAPVAWRAKDGRSGAAMQVVVTEAELVEAKPAGK